MNKKGLSTGVKAQMIFWALFMPVSLILSIWAFLPSASLDDAFSGATIDAQVLRTEPVGQLNMPGEKSATEEVATAVAAPPPKETYDAICAACHATGLLESPKFGDAAAWEKRIADAGGIDGVVQIAITGKGAMPPKGGASLSDEDFAKVVYYLAGQEP